MRVKPSPKHAKRMHKALLAAMDNPSIDLHKPFIKVMAQAARKAFGIKVRFIKDVDKRYMGFWNKDSNTIEVASMTSSLDMFATLCHELAHAYCYKNNIHMGYHTLPEYLEHHAASGTELYVENLGEQLFLLVFPGQVYKRTIFAGKGNKAK